MVTIESITVADPAEAWEAAGFAVDGDTCRVGSIELRLAGADAGRGLFGWTLRGARSSELDGLPTELSTAEDPPDTAPPHPNGVTRIDHVVAFTPDRARTVEALEAAGLDLRRLRDEPTPAGGGPQAFFRLGEAILEVIEAPGERKAPPDTPARLWGLAFLTESLDRTKRLLGPRLSDPRPAVQPGRRIAALRRDAGLSFGCAFMSAEAE
ncbi:MAG: VOC family protein [Actinomycetota bacterium]|nr:VOC family protein [Actinomycetota bacterium]